MPVALEIRQSVLSGDVLPRHQPAWQCVDEANGGSTPSSLGFGPLGLMVYAYAIPGGWNEQRLNKMVMDDGIILPQSLQTRSLICPHGTPH